MPQLVSNLITIALITIACGSLVLWVQAISRLLRGKPLLIVEPGPAAAWGLVDLMVIGAAFVLLPSLAVLLFRSLYQIDPAVQNTELTGVQLAGVFFSGSVANLGVFLLAMILLTVRVRASLKDLGFARGHVAGDLRLGLIAFMMLSTPVLAIQWLLTRWWPSEHPVETMLGKQPSAGIFLVAGFAAVIVAPLVEEFFFRVILQGWLENVNRFWGNQSRLLYGAGKPSQHQQAESHNPADQEFSEEENREVPALNEVVVHAEQDNPYLVSHVGPADISGTNSPVMAELATNLRRPAMWPIVVSATVFAAMHVGHGPDPIPLFVLAAGLGYLYQRTHRILPCIVVHVLLNAFSVTMLWLSIAFGL